MQHFGLMSFNIDGYRADCAAERRWDNRAALCMSILQRYGPDLIGFQEVQEQNRPALEIELAEYVAEYGVKSCDQQDEHSKYNPIYWKKDRFDRIEGGAFYLSKTPERWSKSWDAEHVRSLTWVRLRCRQTGISFIHANTHLDHRGLQSRIESSELIVQRLMALHRVGNLPVLLSGDFNARAWSPSAENVYTYPPPVLPTYLPPGGTVHRVYTEHGFTDSYLEAGCRNQLAMNTYHDYFGDAFPPVALRIDWILYLNGEQKIQVQKYQLIRDASPPVHASDHYPIMALLAWC